MAEIQLPLYESIRSCRYCFCSDDDSDLVAPCRCKGSTKYVHKKCLKEWFEKSNNRIVVPAAFNQYNFSCEICHTKYKFDCKKIQPTTKLWTEISLYILFYTLALAVSYMCIGLLMQQSERTAELFTKRGSHWENVFYNGFVMVHILIAIFYITAAVLQSLSHTDPCCTFCCCMYFDSGGLNDCNNSNDDACIFCIVFLVIMGILGTVLMIYYDVVNRVKQRYNNKSYLITDIKPYEDSEEV
jgi:hypothetical protein